MSLKRLRHSVLAIWLGLFTLAVIGLEQNQLAGSVIAVAAADSHGPSQVGQHPENCPMLNAGGHTHKGHADCAVCGVEAALAYVTLPSVVLPAVPAQVMERRAVAAPVMIAVGRQLSPYSSRGPPTLS